MLREVVGFRYFFGVVLLTTLASCVYGIVHDQITVRICPEYFTVWHDPMSASEDLTQVGLVWGIIATWWFGAIAGSVLGFFAAYGPGPKVCPVWIFRQTMKSLAVVGSVAAAAGLLAWGVHFIVPSSIMGSQIAELGLAKQQAFSVDFVVHNVSYLGSAVAALYLARRIAFRRREMISCEDGACSVG